MLSLAPTGGEREGGACVCLLRFVSEVERGLRATPFSLASPVGLFDGWLGRLTSS